MEGLVPQSARKSQFLKHGTAHSCAFWCQHGEKAQAAEGAGAGTEHGGQPGRRSGQSAPQALASVRWGQRRRPNDEPVTMTRLSHVDAGRGVCVWAPGTRRPRTARLLRGWARPRLPGCSPRAWPISYCPGSPISAVALVTGEVHRRITLYFLRPKLLVP